ncbi:probable proline--tRNA ligase, mitochondrial [Chiloscyllium plagiosum]|uniref:probable proline--tRNA ligase, mitochondrial n=1 Tax=Chiloscyllium plagiosum TaxID=36176 RepID=UPI001CB8896F|nr:probable proline--tRNA ligase, mitochondrial [Chiloscyllium plagiosum]XP_043556066.1 probable proline--tRNA ligase, mitochondrial [Chiloscyllium plagiosum]XP_043556067.1 probable proline--tRNA ligase, mitochondrial [Chiloscyllium plagiosum]
MEVAIYSNSRQLFNRLFCNILHLHRSYYHHGRSKRILLSRLFQPMNLREDRTTGVGRSSDITCKSQRLMLQAGLIQPANTGCFHYLPYTVRAMEKLVRVIDKEMQSIGGQKVNMPSLTSASLWKTSERWDLLGKELFRLKDRHDMEYCLSPTHEEAVTELIAMQGNLSYRQLPLMLYQVTRKFRDEPKPRFGLLRGREFYMKDMYTFDVSEGAAMETYNLVSQAYSCIFGQLGLQFVKVRADTGNIGGKMSHEFQLPADIGEDRLLMCSDCHFAANVEAMTDTETNCPQCHGKLKESKGIEVGHTFNLGTKYSYILGASYSNTENKPVVTEMGCFGLGVTRILAAAIEVLSTEDEIRWPSLLAPYQVCIIPPKKGSKEELSLGLSETLYDTLIDAVPQLHGEVLLDDRSHLTIGKRLKDASRLGYPYVVIAGKRVLENPPVFEVSCQNNRKTVFLTQEGVLDLLRNVKIV